MPGILCKCGEIVKYGDIPNENESLYISDVEFDNFVGLIDSEELYEVFKHVLECANCKRLLMFKNGFEFPPVIYSLDK